MKMDSPVTVFIWIPRRLFLPEEEMKADVDLILARRASLVNPIEALRTE
jgi:hypothetical protein